MNDDIIRYASDPKLLLDLLSSVIDYLNESNNSVELKHKKIQLFEINKAIKSLEKKGINIPDSLRSEKSKLITEISNFSTTPKLQLIQNGLEEALKNIENTDQAEKKHRNPKSKLPKTDNTTLRSVLLNVLKKAGGKAKVKDIKNCMEEDLKDQLLPGDLELRADGKSVAWFNNVQWERLRMVEAGILRNDSPNGYWELSEAE